MGAPAWNIGLPPEGALVALVVRKWFATTEDGLRISFLASDPSQHIAAFTRHGATANVQFEPSQTVRMGQLFEDEDGLMVLDEDGDQADFEATAILAWAHVPSFAMDQAAAREADLLLRRVKIAAG